MKNTRILVLATLHAAFAAGCGSSSDNGTTAGNDSGSAQDATPSAQDATSSDANTTADVSRGSGRSCAGPTCTGGEVCCAPRGGTPSCLTVVACAAADVLACTSTLDCNGQQCCGSNGSMKPLGTQCAAACPGGTRVVCRNLSDCAMTDTDCTAGSSTGNLYSTCRLTPPDSGITATEAGTGEAGTAGEAGTVEAGVGADAGDGGDSGGPADGGEGGAPRDAATSG